MGSASGWLCGDDSPSDFEGCTFLPTSPPFRLGQCCSGAHWQGGWTFVFFWLNLFFHHVEIAIFFWIQKQCSKNCCDKTWIISSLKTIFSIWSRDVPLWDVCELMYHGDFHHSIRGLDQVGGNETDLTEAAARWNSSKQHINLKKRDFRETLIFLEQWRLCVCFFFGLALFLQLIFFFFRSSDSI